MPSPPSPNPQNQALANLRYHLRRFLHFSEDAATAAGLTPQQHQLLLQIAGAAPGTLTTVGYLADRLALRHHTVVELGNRSVTAGLILRQRDPDNGRQVIFTLTDAGLRTLDGLSTAHTRELHELAPELLQALHRCLEPPSEPPTP